MNTDKIHLILEMTKMAKAADKEKQEAEVSEKRQRTLSAITEKVLERVNGWLAEPEVKEHLANSINSFFENGDDETGSLMKYLDGGCGIYFGRIDYEAVARKDFGAYVLGLEKANEGSHYPYVMKIQARAQYKLHSLLSKKLGVERLEMEHIAKMLEVQKNGFLDIRFVSAEELVFEAGKNSDSEPVVLGTTEDVIGTTPIDIEIVGLNLLSKGEVLVSRTDWYEGCLKIPEPNVVHFNMYHVPKPREVT